MKFSSKKRRFIILIVIVVLIIVLLNLFQKEVKGFFYYISCPIQKSLWGAGDRVSDFFESFFRIKSLKKETDELKLKNQELLSQITVLQEQKEENKVLREALGIELQKEFKLALAQIISKDISQDFILIDKGLEDGISENMPVITQQRVLLGKVSEVYKNFSKVMLIFNKKSSFDATIQREKSEISGVVKGKGNFRVSFDFISQEKDISKEDIVVTSALGRIFPEGLLVGQIEKIKKSDVEPFQELEVKPFFDIKDIEGLFIITEY